MPKSKIDFKKERIKDFFLLLKSKKQDDLDEKEKEILQNGMIYIQMRLPIENITKEFEDLLKDKIEHNIIQASIRKATEDDLESVMNLYNKSWLTSNTPFRPISLEALKSILINPDTAFLIARVYGKDAGFAILDFDGESDEYGIIAGLGVLPRFQNRGLGTILGLAIWNYLKEKNVIELRCEVYKDNKASYRFIKSLGFKEYGKVIYEKSDFANNNK